MSMEISNRYEEPYWDRLQMNRQENTKESTRNNENENIPTPKDEYISSEKSGTKLNGLYRMGQDKKGNPKVIYDNPEKAKKRKDAKSAEPTEDAEKTTTNTDKVDREIEKLKEEKKQIEQQIKSANNDEKIKELQKKLAQIERELSQKNNDTYRRQNAVIS